MNKELQAWIGRIEPLDRTVMDETEKRLDRLTKPKGSLGRLEEIAVQLSGITRSMNPDITRKAVVIMAGDHGVCEEGVSAYPQEVTQQMVLNFLNGGAAVNVLARHVGADVKCVDIGVKTPIEHPDLIVRNVRRGTANMAAGSAMTRQEAEEALLTGIRMAGSLHEEGYRLLATGDMGIGNTTASSALLSLWGGISPEESAGRGTGINEATLLRKQEVIRRAIAVNDPDPSDAVDTLAKVGGLEIAGLAGLMIGAAALRVPVVVDGFISSSAALAAVKLAPACADYLLASHLSGERGHASLLQTLRLKPILHMDMRLGEGTGALLSLPVVEASIKIVNEMATFDSAGVSDAT